MVTTGEGATSEGEWHESINFAAVHKLPIVFVADKPIGDFRALVDADVSGALHKAVYGEAAAPQA